MTLSNQLASEAVEVLHDSSSRRTGVKSVSDGIPGDVDFVTSTLVLEMQEQLLGHPGSFKDISSATANSSTREIRLRPQTMRLRPGTRPLLRRCCSVGRLDVKLSRPEFVAEFLFREEERGVGVGEPSDLIALELDRRAFTGV